MSKYEVIKITADFETKIVEFHYRIDDLSEINAESVIEYTIAAAQDELEKFRAKKKQLSRMPLPFVIKK